MPILTTHGIEILVEAKHDKKASAPEKSKFVFGYTIRITNKNNFPVQLLKRSWQIFDSVGVIKKAGGDGVIGQQPIIEPNQSHEYQSWSILWTDIGRMSGSYLMINLMTNEKFQVEIPPFQLIIPERLN